MVARMLEYIHNNPLQEHWRLAEFQENYRYSSARFYIKEQSEFRFIKHAGAIIATCSAIVAGCTPVQYIWSLYKGNNANSTPLRHNFSTGTVNSLDYTPPTTADDYPFYYYVCCTKGGGGCFPTQFGGTWGCAFQTPCTNCTGAAIMPSSGGKLTTITGEGFVNFSLGVSFAASGEDLFMVNDSILLSAQFTTGVENFLEKIYGYNTTPVPISKGKIVTAPTGYKFTVINAYGRGILALAPNNYNVPYEVGASFSCTCQGTGTCTANTVPFKGSYCSGTCKPGCCAADLNGRIILQGAQY